MVYHTNHYLADSMLEHNLALGISSVTRYDRIRTLLDNASRPYGFQTFLLFSADRHDGPDNSIFRTGSLPKRTRTMAVWAVSVPPQGSPRLHVRLYNPGQGEQLFEYDTGDVFRGKVRLD